ncbi:MAG TPA: hypothetical protein VIG66_00390, partial [Noviherbaspirillum sp.]
DGMDTLSDAVGNNLFMGGAGDDTIIGGAGNAFIAGGSGNDTITTGAGNDVIAFNAGDGMDTVLASWGANNTVSLGGGIQYANLLFSKSGEDLVLATGTNDQLTFKNWYSNTSNRTAAHLQVFIEGSTDYAPASGDSIRDNKVEQFDFRALVAEFDAARAAAPGLNQWALSAALAQFHVDGSDTVAIGGDLAHHYATSGNLTAVPVDQTQALLANTQFGSGRQLFTEPATPVL